MGKKFDLRQLNILHEQMKTIADKSASKIKLVKFYWCTVTQVYSDIIVDVKWNQGSQSVVFSKMVNKSGVILDIGDLVLLVAPMGDLSDMFIISNQNNNVKTSANSLVGVYTIGGANNTSGLIRILDEDPDNPAMEIFGHSIDFYDFLQTKQQVGSIEINRELVDGAHTGAPSLSTIAELGCAAKIGMRNLDGTFDNALVVNNKVSEGIRNLDINVPFNIYPGDTSDVGAEFTPTGTNLFGITNLEQGNLTKVNALDCIDLEVSGTKNCKQSTKNFGDRLFYSYEFGDNQLGDHGLGKINNGECVIAIAPIIKESINLESNYIVKFFPDESCEYKITKTPNYFIITCNKDIEFGWELMGDRIGFEHKKLEYAKNVSSVLNTSNTINPLLDSLNNNNIALLNKSLFKELDSQTE